jgi:hypothetical protein
VGQIILTFDLGLRGIVPHSLSQNQSSEIQIDGISGVDILHANPRGPPAADQIDAPSHFYQHNKNEFLELTGVDISTLGRLLQGELDSDDSTRYSA